MVPWYNFVECGAGSEVGVINSFKIEREEVEEREKSLPLQLCLSWVLKDE